MHKDWAFQDILDYYSQTSLASSDYENSFLWPNSDGTKSFLTSKFTHNKNSFFYIEDFNFSFFPNSLSLTRFYANGYVDSTIPAVSHLNCLLTERPYSMWGDRNITHATSWSMID